MCVGTDHSIRTNHFHASGIASDVEHAVGVSGIVAQTLQLDVNHAKHHLVGRDRNPERDGPTFSNFAEEAGGIALPRGAHPIRDGLNERFGGRAQGVSSSHQAAA